MRRLMKFLHTMEAIGLMGAMACLLVLLRAATPAPEPSPAYAAMAAAMSRIATWVYLPSMALTLIAGLAAIAVNRAFHNAGWAWAKLATGVLLFEWSFVGVVQPLQTEADVSARALLGSVDAAAAVTLGASAAATRNSLWVLLAVAAANVVLGIWRPKLTRLPE